MKESSDHGVKRAIGARQNDPAEYVEFAGTHSSNSFAREAGESGNDVGCPIPSRRGVTQQTAQEGGAFRL